MKILVWKAYGDIDVYCAESVEQLDKITQQVKDLMQYAEQEDDFKRLTYMYSLITAGSKMYSKKEQIILELVNKFGQGMDMFEEFYFTKVEYL